MTESYLQEQIRQNKVALLNSRKTDEIYGRLWDRKQMELLGDVGDILQDDTRPKTSLVSNENNKIYDDEFTLVNEARNLLTGKANKDDVEYILYSLGDEGRRYFVLNNKRILKELKENKYKLTPAQFVQYILDEMTKNSNKLIPPGIPPVIPPAPEIPPAPGIPPRMRARGEPPRDSDEDEDDFRIRTPLSALNQRNDDMSGYYGDGESYERQSQNRQNFDREKTRREIEQAFIDARLGGLNATPVVSPANSGSASGSASGRSSLSSIPRSSANYGQEFSGNSRDLLLFMQDSLEKTELLGENQALQDEVAKLSDPFKTKFEALTTDGMFDISKLNENPEILNRMTGIELNELIERYKSTSEIPENYSSNKQDGKPKHRMTIIKDLKEYAKGKKLDGSGLPKFRQQRNSYIPQLNRYKSTQGQGLPIFGDQIKDYLKRPLVYGRGVSVETQTQPQKTSRYNKDRKYFDKIYIDLGKLKKNNILFCKYIINNSNIQKLKTQIVSNDVKDVIIDIIDNKYNAKVYKSLNDNDKRIIRNFVKAFKFDLEFDDEDNDKFNNQFQILLGSYYSGNDSPEVKTQLRSYVRRAIAENLVSHKDGLTLLYELS